MARTLYYSYSIEYKSDTSCCSLSRDSCFMGLALVTSHNHKTPPVHGLFPLRLTFLYSTYMFAINKQVAKIYR